MNKNLIYAICSILLGILLIVFFAKQDGQKFKDAEKQIETLRKELIISDSVKRVGDSTYSKLVDDTKKEKDLRKELEGEKSELTEKISKLEKIISKSKITVVPKDKTTITVGKVDTLMKEFNYVATYPDTNKPFITYKSNVNLVNGNVKSDWSFTPIDVDIVLTEKENGMWNTYISTPEYFNVPKVEVKSIPKEDMVKPKKKRAVDFYGGAGIMKIGTETKPTVNVGIGALGFQLSGGYGGSNYYHGGLMKKF